MDITQGLTELSFGALFVGFFIYSLKQNDKREDRLHGLVDNQNQVIETALDRLETIESNQRAMHKDIADIKQHI